MRVPRPVATSLFAVLLVASVPPTAAPPQVAPRQPPMRVEERYAIGGDLSRYEALYGAPEFRGIDDEYGRPWPRTRNIRTIATLAAFPGRAGEGGAEAATAGRVLEHASKYASHLLCGDRYCVGVRPVEEMVEVLMLQGRSWLHRKVEVIGAVDEVGDPLDRACPCWAFRVWSVQLFAERVERSRREGPTLETLVRGPEAVAGRPITVGGTFRGANLFEDLPPETRRDPADWVLKDGPFSIWVTGRPPQGSGFSLDSGSRSDCRWRLEVQGKVETAGGYVYLRARRVMLVRRERSDEGEP